MYNPKHCSLFISITNFLGVITPSHLFIPIVNLLKPAKSRIYLCLAVILQTYTISLISSIRPLIFILIFIVINISTLIFLGISFSIPDCNFLIYDSEAFYIGLILSSDSHLYLYNFKNRQLLLQILGKTLKSSSDLRLNSGSRFYHLFVI